MKKTITILSALAITGSPALALNVVNYKTQNFQNILKRNIAKSNGTVSNDIITQIATSDYFYFQARLSNSTYNGLPAFMSQIKLDGSWPTYFFQWLDDDDFDTSYFPELNDHTQHGFFNDPITWANRLEKHMGHFGCWRADLSETALCMINGKDPHNYLGTFGPTIEAAYNQAAKAGNVTGIDLNFGFTYDVSSNNKKHSILSYNYYTVEKPNYVILTS